MSVGPGKREKIGSSSAVSSIVDGGTELTKPAALLRNPQYLSGVERLRYNNQGTTPPFVIGQTLLWPIFRLPEAPLLAHLPEFLRKWRNPTIVRLLHNSANFAIPDYSGRHKIAP